MTECRECQRLKAELESALRYIGSHQGEGRRLFEEVRTLRKEVEALRKGETPKRKLVSRKAKVHGKARQG